MRTRLSLGSLLATAAIASTAVAQPSAPDRRVQNLHAFARLYGYVRFFHPSDEAASVDWDRMAILGAAQVKDARGPDDLKRRLEGVFGPIAPSVLLYREASARPAFRHLTDADKGDLTTVSWQHLGVLLDTGRTNAYWSLRANRPATKPVPNHIQSSGRTLFTELPPTGEGVELPLGSDLRAWVPVSLRADSVGTLPRSTPESLAVLRRALDGIVSPNATADSEDVRLAGIVIAWNVFQHFYPYFDVVPVDWMGALDPALERAFADQTAAGFHETLQRLVALLGDGHGSVLNPAFVSTGGIPWELEWIEDRAVVTASREPAFKRGDVILAIDDAPVARMLARAESLISGSPQWKRYRALGGLAAGDWYTRVRVRLDRDGQERVDTVTRFPRYAVREYHRPPIAELEQGIWYVDLRRATRQSIDSVIPSLAAARGVIIDLRGYPNGNHGILGNLLRIQDTSRAWMRIPQAIYPDRQRLASYRPFGWGMRPTEPHISGRVAFMTDGRAISYAESVMGLVEHYRLGAIVGQPTAGANGNVNRFNIPGGFSITWTGMRVVKHDGSQHHLKGVQPTVPAARTIRGVREGRDEVLETALKVVRPDR